MRDFFEPNSEDEDEDEDEDERLIVEEIPLKDITVLERGPEVPQREPMVVIKLMEQKQGKNRGRVMPTIRLVV